MMPVMSITIIIMRFKIPIFFFKDKFDIHFCYDEWNEILIRVVPRYSKKEFTAKI